jgi:hypothetical protein
MLPSQAEVSMNQRLPRLMLLVVLLVTMVGVFRGGTPDPADRVLAQDATVCGPWMPYEAIAESEATPGPNAGFEITRTYEMVEASNSNLEDAKALTEITLFKDGQLAVVSDESFFIAVDSGLVELTVCGEQTQIGIQLPNMEAPESFGPGTYELPPNSAVFIDPDDPYFLTGLSDGEAPPSAGVQQLDFELSSNELPGAQAGDGGSKLRIVSGILRKVCSGGGC